MEEMKPDTEVKEETSVPEEGVAEATAEKPAKKPQGFVQFIWFIVMSLIAFALQMLIAEFGDDLLALCGVSDEGKFIDVGIEEYTLAGFLAYLIANIVAKVISYILNRKKTFAAVNNLTFSLSVYVIMCVALIVVESFIALPIQNFWSNLGVGEGASMLTIITYSIPDFLIVFLMEKFVIMNNKLFVKKKEEVAAADETAVAVEDTAAVEAPVVADEAVAEEAPVTVAEEAPAEETAAEEAQSEEAVEEVAEAVEEATPVEEVVTEEPLAETPQEEEAIAEAEAVEEQTPSDEAPAAIEEAAAEEPAEVKVVEDTAPVEEVPEEEVAAAPVEEKPVKKAPAKKPAAKKASAKKPAAKKEEPKKEDVKADATSANVTVLFEAPDSDSPKGKFVVIKDDLNPDRPYKFQLKANNGQVLYESESFKIKPRAKQIEVFRNTINNGTSTIDSEKNGTYRYKLFKADGSLYGVGEGYKTKASAESALESVKNFCNTSNVLEDTTVEEKK